MKTPPSKAALQKKRTPMREIMDTILKRVGIHTINPLACSVNRDSIEFQFWNGERFVLTRLSKAVDKK